MAKLPRVFQNLFGAGGDQSHFGQFGSRISVPPGVDTKDPASIQALSAFIMNGWTDAVASGNTQPFLEDMNGIMFLIFYQICYGFQSGIPEWDPSTEYDTGSIVRKTGTTELYGSLIDANTGNALPNQTADGHWNYLNPASVQPGVMADFGGASAPFGWLMCDGSVYAQGSFPGLFTAIGGNWNIGGEGAGNFRVPDLRGRTSIGAGTGSGLSPRALAQLLGEQAHQLITSEMPSHSHSASDSGHVHGSSNGDNFCLSGAHNDAGIPFSPSPQFNRNNSNTGTGHANISVGNTGGDGSHNNMQPSAVVSKIIKT